MGQVARLLHLRHHMLLYDEERTDFELSSSYMTPCERKETSASSSVSLRELWPPPGTDNERAADLEGNRLHSFTSRECHSMCIEQVRIARDDRASQEIVPTRTNDGITLVDWYTKDDPSNPQNWSSAKKLFVTAQICAYTFSVYIGSSLYVASEPEVAQLFGVGEVAAALGLALYGKL